MKKRNLEKQREYQKRYEAAHPEKIKEMRKKYRLKRKDIPKKEMWRKRIFDRDGMFCKNCGSKDNLTLQHRIPESIGGEYSYENLEILCLQCNIKHYHQLVKKALKFYFQNHKSFGFGDED